jgi:hypothetical protein
MSVLKLFGGGAVTITGVEIRNGSDAGSPANFSMNESTSVNLFAEVLYSNGTSAPATGSLVWNTSQLNLPDYIAVGNQTGDSVSYSSTNNGANFTEFPISGNFVANAIAQSGVSLVTVTEITGAIYYSTNGTSWALASTPGFSGQSMKDVIWSGTQFVAVGDDGNVLTSDDGINWTLRRFNIGFEQLNGVVWNGSQFVAVGGEILTSPDGIIWTNRMTMGGTQTLRKVTWSGTQFVAVGNNANIVTSPDGITWTTQTGHIGGPMYDIAWSGSIYVAVQDTDTGDIVTSPDGITWTKVSVGIANSGWWAVVWDGTKFLMVGDEGFVISSVNGTSWSLMFSDFGAGPQLHDIIKPQLLGGNLLLSGQSGNQITVTAPAVPSDIAGYSVSVTKDSLFTDPINITITDVPVTFTGIQIRVGSDAGTPVGFSIEEGNTVDLYAVETYSDGSFIPCIPFTLDDSGVPTVTSNLSWAEGSGGTYFNLGSQTGNKITVTGLSVSSTQSITVLLSSLQISHAGGIIIGNTFPGSPGNRGENYSAFLAGPTSGFNQDTISGTITNYVPPPIDPTVVVNASNVTAGVISGGHAYPDPGANVTFTATPSGTGPFTYLWSGPGGATGTNSTLTVSNVSAGNNGSYSCTVTGGAGNATDSKSLVTRIAYSPPSFSFTGEILQYVSGSFQAGSPTSVSLSVFATGPGFQYYTALTQTSSTVAGLNYSSSSNVTSNWFTFNIARTGNPTTSGNINMNMHVVIPAGDLTYMPITTDVAFSIPIQAGTSLPIQTSPSAISHAFVIGVPLSVGPWSWSGGMGTNTIYLISNGNLGTQIGNLTASWGNGPEVGQGSGSYSGTVTRSAGTYNTGPYPLGNAPIHLWVTTAPFYDFYHMGHWTYAGQFDIIAT